MTALLILTALMLLLLGAVTVLGGGAKRTVRVYPLLINGNGWRSKMVFASRWVRALIKVGIFPAKRSGITPTGHGLTRDQLGVAKTRVILHEQGHQVERALMPVKVHPRLKIFVWPVFYFKHKAWLEYWATLFENLMMTPGADSTTLPDIYPGVPSPRVTIPDQVYKDGVAG